MKSVWHMMLVIQAMEVTMHSISVHPARPSGQRGGARDGLDPAALLALVRGIASDRQTWMPIVQHHPQRWWTRLVGTSELDVWLLTWPLDVATELHDHGDSWAAYSVVGGQLAEVAADRDGRTRQRTLDQGQSRLVPPGGVHDVVNLNARPATSIHAYSPPLTSMTYYRQRADGLEAVRTETKSRMGPRW